jgi:hypothetical protein
MSLISSASPWISDDPQKKRTSTLRKTIKKTLPQVGIQQQQQPEPNDMDKEPQSYNTDTHGFQSTEAMDSDTRDGRVHEILQKMNTLNIDNDGKNLADFKPLSHPIVQPKRPPMELNYNKDPQPPILMRPVASANNHDLDKNSDYRFVYNQPQTLPPSYTTSGRNATRSAGGDDRLLDKINYMIHLLEEQANEKTNNVMEELVMFSLVGVFLIYVLDSFSRSGRYVR